MSKTPAPRGAVGDLVASQSGPPADALDLDSRLWGDGPDVRYTAAQLREELVRRARDTLDALTEYATLPIVPTGPAHVVAVRRAVHALAVRGLATLASDTLSWQRLAVYLQTVDQLTELVDKAFASGALVARDPLTGQSAAHPPPPRRFWLNAYVVEALGLIHPLRAQGRSTRQERSKPPSIAHSVNALRHDLSRDVHYGDVAVSGSAFAAWAVGIGTAADGELEDLLAAPSVRVAATAPIQRATAQDEAILAMLRELGHDPLRVPRGAKRAARDALTRSAKSVFTSTNVFDKAWDRLRAASKIRDS